jgi:hypothetical protein
VTGAVRALVYSVPDVGVVVHAFNIGAGACDCGKGGEAARVVLERWAASVEKVSSWIAPECRARRSDALVGEDLAVDDATRGVGIFLTSDRAICLVPASRLAARPSQRTPSRRPVRRGGGRGLGRKALAADENRGRQAPKRGIGHLRPVAARAPSACGPATSVSSQGSWFD